MKKIIKKLPDREGEGLLDRRVLADARVAVGVTYPADNSRIRQEELALLRAQVGSKNRDIVAGEVQTWMIEVPVQNQKKLTVKAYRGRPGNNKALLYIHGGGFAAGTLEMCDNLCRGIAKSTDVTVFSLDYSLAPEYRYPVQVNECFAALAWVYEHAEELEIERGEITICGDSAGGNLAAVCALKDRDEKTGYLRCQILLYPALNIGKFETEDYRWSEECYVCREEGDDYELQKKVIADVGIFDELMQHIYVSSRQALKDPYVCPVLCRDFSGLAQTILAVGEFDYLRPEVMYYARKLDEAGTDVTYIQYQGINHGFAERLGAYPQAEDLMKLIIRAVDGRTLEDE